MQPRKNLLIIIIKTILTSFIFLALLLGGIFLFTSSAKNTNEIGGDLQERKKVKEKVIDYLENSVFETQCGREVFADYYEFGKDDNNLFIWAYICEYYKKNFRLKLGSAFSGPMIIVFSKDKAIKDHWETKPGEEYSKSIRDKIPSKYQEDILNFQTKHKDILNDLEESVRKRARKEKTVKAKNRIVLAPGEVKTIKLKANRTTGYKWFYNIKDKDIVKVILDEYKEEPHREGVVGVGGERILNIKGLKKGTTTIKFEYYRKWNPEKIDKSKEFKVIVKEKTQAHFNFPDNLESEYISMQDWEVNFFDSEEKYPSKYRIAKGQVHCKESSAQHSLPVKMFKRTINGRRYCIETLSEGAAGSIYKEYIYATVKNGNLITINFTVRYQQCGNYAEPKRSECKSDLKEFDPDDIVDRFVKDVELKQ